MIKPPKAKPMPNRRPADVPTADAAGAVGCVSTAAAACSAETIGARGRLSSVLAAPHDGHFSALNGSSAWQIAHSVTLVVIGAGPLTWGANFDHARRGRTSRLA